LLHGRNQDVADRNCIGDGGSGHPGKYDGAADIDVGEPAGIVPDDQIHKPNQSIGQTGAIHQNGRQDKEGVRIQGAPATAVTH